MCNYKMEKDLELKKCYIQEYKTRKSNNAAKRKKKRRNYIFIFLLECRGNEFDAKSNGLF